MSPDPDANQPEHWQVARESRLDPQPEVVVVQAPVPRRRYVVVASAALVIGLGAASLRRPENRPIPVAAAPAVVTVVVTATLPPPSPTTTPTFTPSPSPTSSPSSAATFTPRPVPTSTPTLAPPIAIVKARALNVRAGPGVEHTIVGYAAFGQRYRIIGASAGGAWLRIDFNSLVGWVSVRWVMRSDGTEEILREPIVK